jgi:hypothetical protein
MNGLRNMSDSMRADDVKGTDKVSLTGYQTQAARRPGSGSN